MVQSCVLQHPVLVIAIAQADKKTASTAATATTQSAQAVAKTPAASKPPTAETASLEPAAPPATAAAVDSQSSATSAKPQPEPASGGPSLIDLTSLDASDANELEQFDAMIQSAGPFQHPRSNAAGVSTSMAHSYATTHTHGGAVAAAAAANSFRQQTYHPQVSLGGGIVIAAANPVYCDRAGRETTPGALFGLCVPDRVTEKPVCVCVNSTTLCAIRWHHPRTRGETIATPKCAK